MLNSEPASEDFTSMKILKQVFVTNSNLIDVLFELVEEVVPASDEPALVLVVDHVQLVALPSLFDLENNRNRKV